jgi:hypothetical protein
MPRKPQTQAPTTNRAACDMTIAALHAAGRLEQVDAATVMAAQRLADAVDSDPAHASLWAQYRAALAALKAVGADAQGDDFGDLLRRLDGMSAPVGDSKAR